MPLNESTPEELEPTTVAYDRVTVGEAALLSSVGAASVRGRDKAAKLIKYFILSNRTREWAYWGGGWELRSVVRKPKANDLHC